MNLGNLLPVQAEHLRVQRKKHGYTQPEISELLGCTVKTYRSWEKGKTIISSEFLVQLSGLFDVSCDYLLGRIEERDHDVKFVCEYTGLAGSALEQGVDAEIPSFTEMEVVLTRPINVTISY